MSVRKLILAISVFAFIGGSVSTSALAGEVKKVPLTKEEITVLQQHSGAQIQALLKGDDAAIESFAAEKGIDAVKLKVALESFSDDTRSTLLSVSLAELDAIIAGQMDSGDIILTALATLGILVLVAMLGA